MRGLEELLGNAERIDFIVLENEGRILATDERVGAGGGTGWIYAGMDRRINP